MVVECSGDEDRDGDPAEVNRCAQDLQAAVYNLRETESLVRECVEGLHCFIQGGRDTYRILFPLPNDRLQEVYLEVTQGKQGERLLSVASLGSATPAWR